jgi:hypothetical protein
MSEDTSSGIFDTASAPIIDRQDSSLLDALLDDPSFASGPKLPKTQLKTHSSKKDTPNWLLIGGVVIGLAILLVAVGIAILTI